jgi:SAM-dependent methyltransferase
MTESETKTNNAGTTKDVVAPCSSHCYPPVLDACCGPKMFWFDKSDERVMFHDKRSESYEIKPDRAYPKGTTIEIAPDVQGDFTDMVFPDETFWLVVFDPPHIAAQQELGIFTKKYGCLSGDWREMLRLGFRECFRVLKPGGTLIFKWAESSHSVSEVLKLTPEKPLFGHRTRQHSKTHWIAFMKPPCGG